MSRHKDSVTVNASLTAYGDALLYGTLSSYSAAPGLLLKHRLFAWHEPSFYGTELEIRQAQGVELVVLPAEQVVPYFAERRLLAHVDWTWEAEAERLMKLAPALGRIMEERAYVPDLDVFRTGKLQWTWENASLDEEAARLLAEVGDPTWTDAMKASFSAAVYSRYYATEEAAADLRREYPLLFTGDRGALAGLEAEDWLVAIGWKADNAPFRPLLQLLEPDEEEMDWRLRLIAQDKQDPAAIYPVRLSQRGHAAGDWPAAWDARVQERAEGWLTHLLASLSPQLLAGGPTDVLGQSLTDQSAWRFLTEDSRRLLEAGWQVLLPAWWEAARKRKPKLRAKVTEESGAGGAGGKSGSLFGLNSLVDFNWRIAIGDTDLSEAEFHELVARGERIVKFRGQWITLDPQLLEHIRSAMARVNRSKGLTFQEVLQMQLTGGWRRAAKGAEEEASDDAEDKLQLEVELNSHLTRLMTQLTSQSDWPPLPIPSGLQANLRAYQQEGFAWLAFLRGFGLGACLADDMGLGKTVQLITYLLHIKESAEPGEEGHMPSLVICPTSVLGNWQKEVSRFAPALRAKLHYGSKRSSGEAFEASLRDTDVLLTSFATAALDQELLQSYTWTTIVLDEAQNIKNAGTRQSAAVRSFRAKHRVAMTGTPIENRLSELWSIYDFMNPGFLGSPKAFQEQYAQAIEKERDEQRTADLQKLVKPFMLRRKKKDPNIMLDLPDKNEMKTYINLTPEQSALYDQAVTDLLERVRQLEGMERKGAILAALTQLKQLCDHPVLMTKEELPESLAGAESETRETLIGRSSKLERLVAMVKELRAEGERCLIFTQYIGMGNMLQRVLHEELGEPILYLHGGTSKAARDSMVEQFQSRTLPANEQPNIFILSIKAGGVGLNLTAANHVFHFDRWWNPAVENQATDRAYRMGQTKDVQVHKFIALGTLEERIDEMLESKQQLSDNVITSSEGWITELSTDALKDLFTLRRNWGG
ncbi:DEAD/DEAH box helicase [Paenibacillus methanolicus]|uniref:SNF2 family DNA or RNA helicase n=1 Tax=Paenibacillus methanolicus TaxID=582686 RepID=A0A5S5BP72_9BACL|nr:DEAD/DEAH box helicase [Paenibacillus methanolicus]TYP68088.1 SNF2 family DNA or RNA helicase [Paenibacillus methanolicus]